MSQTADAFLLGAEAFADGARGQPLPLNSSSVALEKARIVKSGQGKLYGFTVYNSNASSQFILLFDISGTIPASGAVPDMVFPIAGASAVFVGFADVGRAFTQGCVLVNSSTAATLTIGAADCWYDVQYV